MNDPINRTQPYPRLERQLNLLVHADDRVFLAVFVTIIISAFGCVAGLDRLRK